MQNCSNLYLLSTIACQLADCLSEDDLAILAADLIVLSDMLANIAARNAVCEKQIHRIPDFSGTGVSFIPAVSGTIRCLSKYE